MPTHALIVAFDIIVLLSVVLNLAALVTAMLSKSIARSPIWYSMMTAGVVYSLSYGLLVGRQETPDEPPLGLCVTQTVLIYGVPVLSAIAMANIYIELYFILRGLKSGKFGPPKRGRSFWLAITPWLFFIAVIIGDLLYILLGGHLDLVQRAPTTNFYCHLEDSLPAIITAVIAVIAILGIMLPLQVWLAFTIYRSSDTLKRLADADRQLFIGLYARLTLASLTTVLGFGLAMDAVWSPNWDSSTLGYPIVGLTIAIAFATQMDILRAWVFWRPPRPSSSVLFTVSQSHELTNEAGIHSVDESPDLEEIARSSTILQASEGSKSWDNRERSREREREKGEHVDEMR